MVQNQTDQTQPWTIDKLMELSRWAACERVERDRGQARRTRRPKPSSQPNEPAETGGEQ